MAGHGHGADHGGQGHKGVALLIAVLALFLALAETGAKGAQTEALAKNVEAANLWIMTRLMARPVVLLSTFCVLCSCSCFCLCLGFWFCFRCC